MRTAFACTALIVSTALAGTAALAGTGPWSPFMERSERVLDGSGLRGIEVENPRGPVELLPSPDGRAHVVAVKVTRALNAHEAKRMSDMASVETSVVGGQLKVVAHYPRHIDTIMSFWDVFSDHGRRPGVEIRLTIQAPVLLPATVSTASGNVWSEGRVGSQVLHSVSGEVKAFGAGGPVDIQTASGDVELRGFSSARARSTSGDVNADSLGALVASTASGDVTVGSVRGALELESTSGDIRVASAAAGMSAHTASGEVVLDRGRGSLDLGSTSGDVRATLLSLEREVKLASASGDLAVTLPPGARATLAAHTASGSIDCRIPVTVMGHDRNSLEARLGPGGIPVRLETTSGNVSIMSGGK